MSHGSVAQGLQDLGYGLSVAPDHHSGWVSPWRPSSAIEYRSFPVDIHPHELIRFARLAQKDYPKIGPLRRQRQTDAHYRHHPGDDSGWRRYQAVAHPLPW
jgi:hypothetical protein